MDATERALVVGVELDYRGEDLSRGSELALREAERLAGPLRASVVLVHSTARDERWHHVRREYTSREALGERGKAALDAAVERLRATSVEARLVVSEEHALVAISSVVKLPDSDLVIIGSRSDDVPDDRHLGSVARALVHQCPSAVWVVRATAEKSRGTMLAAADLTPMGERVVRVASLIAGAAEAELHVVHALSMPLEVQLEGMEAEERYLSENRSRAEKQLRAWLAGAGATLHVGLTSPTQAVLAGVRHLGPELVIAGTVSREGIPGLVLGNTAARLLDRLETSLLVVKPK